LDTWGEAMAIGAHPDNIAITSILFFILKKIFFGIIAVKFGTDVVISQLTTIITPKEFYLTVRLQQLNYLC
jgi:hypothetical protein